MPGTTSPVFLVEALPAGSHAVLDGEEARHAVTARRMRAGERLTLSDGAGAAADCVVEAVRPGREPALDVVIEQRRHDPAPRLRVTVAQALAKGDRGELAVELATEAGADAVLPWRAERSVARWEEGPRGAKALARWQATARAAAKQARRTWVPPVEDPVDTPGLAAAVRDSALALVLEGAAEQQLTRVDLPAEGELLLVVGPEGGITDAELAALQAAGAVPVRLGPTVLRTSTAAAVALGALGARTDRWD
ncbi:16S rRNA (uracil(1498)-N(3))-methyltransferase [Amycolatopsis acidiphila]|uniref:Ribosomal RNA small subunit methyltransferase E n=1 Tax=Amycolatopsis acidiphila TaxID=715473 RepID=A0A558A5W6_9PSEU|nr:16S rRNA (uracil(1498)-N(3))-methyltransferase [Amycolatopsis acidiphila]TVT19650.1 16S rRNA (uracil(1498)-N(3))-methyltransferase [Amycolatopsis acidiphila]UIJ61832.1 16S rRNA (uracil(1498)-N(3))-methyltransferase [Amycolatopsis acidiphila]GHG57684.1 ribosomal RNA small subunit methyltransferase E [Amycolatopsis acidiphila]